MTKNVKLNASLRQEKNGQAKKIRNSGFVPAVIYGAKKQNYNIKIKSIDFEHVFAQAGEFNLIDLAIDDQTPLKVIIKEVQKDPVNDKVLHADFYQVDMAQKITTEIPLNFIGESAAVKEAGATLVKNMDKIEIRCLPGDLVSHIDVDISRLGKIDDAVRLHELALPLGLELTSATDEVVVTVMATKVEEEAKPVAAEVPAEGVTPAEGEDKAEAGEEKEEKGKSE